MLVIAFYLISVPLELLITRMNSLVPYVIRGSGALCKDQAHTLGKAFCASLHCVLRSRHPKKRTEAQKISYVKNKT